MRLLGIEPRLGVRVTLPLSGLTYAGLACERPAFSVATRAPYHYSLIKTTQVTTINVFENDVTRKHTQKSVMHPRLTTSIPTPSLSTKAPASHRLSARYLSALLLIIIATRYQQSILPPTKIIQELIHCSLPKMSTTQDEIIGILGICTQQLLP